MKPSCNVVKFDIMNTMPQPNSYDCGLFALACATDLAHELDPVLSEWNIEGMRMHLVECLEKGHLSPFPVKKNRRIPLGRHVHQTVEEKILYCICRLPNHNKVLAMICCTDCPKWYHENCVNINITDYKDKAWKCQECSKFMDSLK